jgi:hypothetical protein
VFTVLNIHTHPQLPASGSLLLAQPLTQKLGTSHPKACGPTRMPTSKAMGGSLRCNLLRKKVEKSWKEMKSQHDFVVRVRSRR